MSPKKSVFQTLSEVDLSLFIKTKPNTAFKYIPWADAWSSVKGLYPTASYSTHKNDVGDPFFISTIGIFVRVSVVIGTEEQTIDYPVLNGANKALKVESYSYRVKEYKWNGSKSVATGGMTDKHVDPATSFDINRAIMRALVKCLALHGLGLYIYKDEDAPSVMKIDSEQLSALTEIHTRLNFSVVETNKAWKIDKLSSLDAVSFDSMVNWLNGGKQ